jgi:hypothetical protein
VICFAKNLFALVAHRYLPMDRPGRTVIYTGCRVEKIDARIDEYDRIAELIIHTRSTNATGTRCFILN